jgi:hypothetical protein
MSVSVRLNRRGATLPLSVIVLALMAVGIAISYARISAERHIGSDTRARLGAFAVAQSGLNRFLANINGKPPAPPAAGSNPTVTYNDLPGGTATVSLRQVRESTLTLLPAVYVITSRGVYTAAKRYDSRAPAAERTVATYALWVPTPFDLNAAFTSLTGVTSNGNSSALSGIDRSIVSPTCPGPKASIPGVAVPNGTFNSTHPETVNGNPEDAAVGLGTGGPGGSAKDEVKIDWAGITAGTAMPADYIYPVWPNPGQMAGWPVTRVNGDLVGLPSNGNGILIVTGNLTINGTVPPRTWNGLILVGGSLTGNGNANIYGALITGLNVKLGIAVPPYDVGNGTKTYQYDSCALTRALGHVGSIQRVRNGWTDTWSSY